MFAVFIFLVLFGQIVQQIMPMFISQRTMYEARERPSKAYSWKAFMIANLAVELAWNSASWDISSLTMMANFQ
jgi:ABC-type multidrug transport system permease subunit